MRGGTKGGLLAVAVMAATLVPNAQALPGDLDPGFNGTGKATVDFGASLDTAYATATAPGGDVVLAGASFTSGPADEDVAVAALTAAGLPDPAFSGDGMATYTDPGDLLSQRAQAVAVQSNGRIVMAGSQSSSPSASTFLVLRFRTNGTLDPSFGSGGVVTTSFPSGSASADAIVIQPNGRIVVAGTTGISNLDFAVARYLADGSPDPSFNGTGKVVTELGATEDTATSLALTPHGKIVVAGESNFLPIGDPAVAVYAKNGQLDPHFGSGSGFVVRHVNGYERANAVAVQADGKIVLALAPKSTSSNSQFGLLRLQQKGFVDHSFSGDGKAFSSFAGFAESFGVAVAADQTIVVAGEAGDANDLAVARFDAAGNLDGSFSSDGMTTTDFAGPADVAWGVAIQPGDGRIVAAGGSGSSAVGGVMAVARYLP